MTAPEHSATPYRSADEAGAAAQHDAETDDYRVAPLPSVPDDPSPSAAPLPRKRLGRQFDAQRQVSLRSMLTLVLGMSVLFSLSVYVSREVFAFVLGVASLLTVALSSMLRARWMIVELAMWLMIAMYLLSAGLAVVGAR